MNLSNTRLNPYLFAGLALSTLLALFIMSFKNFLLFHVLVEGFSIVIGFCAFVIALNSRRFSENNYFLFLGMALGFVASLDLIHTFSYKGMNIFPGMGANPATQLWIAARYLESLCLLAAPLWLTRRLRTDVTLLCLLFLTAFILAAIFFWHIFPDCFVEGEGLTPFKKISEYTICLILLGALGFLRKKRDLMDRKVVRLVAAAIIVTMVSELCFTFYVSVYGISNIAGHVFKVVAFYLIYKAIIVTGLKRPYDLMFRNLKESESRYHQIFDTNQAVKLLLDPEDGVILEANRAACEFYGYSKNEILSKKITDINMLTPEQVHTEMTRAKSVNRLYFNFPHRLASGEIRNVEVYSGPVKTADRTLLFSIIHDITDRKRAEEKLRESENRWKSLARSSPDHILLLDRDLNIEFANFASPGFEVDDLIGTGIVDYVDANRQDEIRGILKNVLKTGEPARYETTYQTPEGRIIYYESVVIPRKSDEKIVGLTLSARDITHQKEADEEKYRLEEQLRQAQKMEAIGTLAGGIAHDFNNILAIIIGNVELAMDDVPEWNPASQNLQEVQQASLRARDVVKQILSFSRKSETLKGPMNMASVVQESLQLLRSSLPTSIEIRRDISKNALPILGDQTQIHQVMINLCTNAGHAMEAEGGVLTVGLQTLDDQIENGALDLAPGRYVKLSVGDTGPGIALEMRDRIFDPYFTTKEVGKGTGMGLAVVHGIVMSHDGYIDVDSTPGEGTVFHVYFPAVETVQTETPDEKFLLPTGHEKILFVDDETSLVKMGKQMMEKLGYRVEGMTDPEAALGFFREHQAEIDLVITDMTMPKMTGDQLTRKLLEIRPDIPIIIASGYSVRIDEQKAGFTGVRAFVEKPLSMRGLAEVIRRVLEER